MRRSGRRSSARKAPWTKAMSDHLWATYVLYLQDPKVTPFRMGKSCIPPHGVCLRVAREARRSWKGAKALTRAANPAEGRKSGSSTPTAENAGAFLEVAAYDRRHQGSSSRALQAEGCIWAQEPAYHVPEPYAFHSRSCPALEPAINVGGQPCRLRYSWHGHVSR